MPVSMCSSPRVSCLPNVLVTGTPGSGKSSLCRRLAELSGLRHLEVGELVRERGLHDGWNERYQCFDLNDDKLCDELESMLAGAGAGGVLVDFHSSSAFPVRWFELVVVLRCSLPVLHSRLLSRGYSDDKMQENLEAEIMQVCLDEVREDWGEEQILELQSDTVEQQEEACARCLRWLQRRTAG